MKQYPKILMAKSNQAINDQAEVLATAKGRDQANYIRDVIGSQADRKDLR